MSPEPCLFGVTKGDDSVASKTASRTETDSLRTGSRDKKNLMTQKFAVPSRLSEHLQKNENNRLSTSDAPAEGQQKGVGDPYL